MPTYDYKCTNGPCGKFEVRQSITSRDQVDCPECHGPAKRLISVPAADQVMIPGGFGRHTHTTGIGHWNINGPRKWDSGR